MSVQCPPRSTWEEVRENALGMLLWCETFMLLGIHFFWVMGKSTPLSADNVPSAFVAFIPFVVLLTLGLASSISSIRAALIRVEPLFHWSTSAILTVLLFYVVLHDPFQPITPLAAPLYLWSVGLSLMLAANLAAHLRQRVTQSSISTPATIILALIAVAFSLWLASGATWAVYFWTASILLHAVAAPVSLRRPNSLPTPSPVQSCVCNAALESLLMLAMVLFVFVMIIHRNVLTGTLETKYPIFLESFTSFPFLLGIAAALLSIRYRMTWLTHSIVAALVLLYPYPALRPLVFVWGYAVTALFTATTRQCGFGYALSCTLIVIAWILGLAGFSFSGMIVHFGQGTDIVKAIIRYDGALIIALTAVHFIWSSFRRWKPSCCARPVAMPSTPSFSMQAGVFITTLALAAVPGLLILRATAWPTRFVSQPVRIPVDKPMGLCHAGYSNSEEEYKTLADLGVQIIRADFRWEGIQPRPDTWDFGSQEGFVDTACKHDVRVIAILDFDNGTVEQDPAGKEKGMYIAPADIPLFLEYVRRTVEHFKGRVYAWEIWNEPDIERFWTGPMDEFYALAAQTAQAVREVDPNAIIIGTATTGPLGTVISSAIDGMHKSGALKKVTHPAYHLYTTDPRHYYMDFLRPIGAARRGGHDGSVWVTETGPPNGGYYPWVSSNERLAEHCIKMYTTATRFGMDTVVWYCMNDADAGSQATLPLESERFFGLLGPNKEWKPSAHAYQLFSRNCSNSAICNDLVKTSGGVAARQLRSTLYRRDNGECTLILWFEPMLRPWGQARVSLKLFNAGDAPVIHDIASGSARTLLDDSVEVSEKPVVITFKSQERPMPIQIAVHGSIVDTLWLAMLLGAVLIVGQTFLSVQCKQNKPRGTDLEIPNSATL